ncbi:MAG: EAL domain-containing protein [Phyllobacteriaceae bacterium]|nr:EAL domain-containing protein [Phyllobacteriaceae bacterium]
MELLARWPHGHGDPVSPDIFVPLIEEAGRIDEFTEHMFDRALHAMQQWPQDIGVSVNFARSQLRQATFAAHIIHKLQQAGVGPQRLTVEITETDELADVALSQGSIQQLRSAGIKIAIDDFGAGYANLNLLHDIDFDAVKIDRKIIVDITTNPKDQAIVQAMVAMTGAIKVGLIAEGVEDKKTAALLRKLGVGRAQGYLFAKPMRQNEALEWISRGAASRSDDNPKVITLQKA